MIRLVALLMVYVFAVIDATLLPRACRKHLKSLFAPLFVSLEAKLLAIVREPATIAPAQPKPITTNTQPAKQAAPARPSRTKTTPTPSARQPTSAPTKDSRIAEAPRLKRAPAPYGTDRAFHAIGQPTIFILPNPQNFQKAAFTTPLSHVQIVTISKLKQAKPRNRGQHQPATNPIDPTRTRLPPIVPRKTRPQRR